MREIKSRGISEETGEWVIGTYIDGYIINGVIEANSEYITIENWVPVREGSIGQYTGLKDINGVKVYEDDIDDCGYVVAYVDGSKGEDLGMEIGFYTQRDNFESWSKLIYGEALEIIGNIHEHPHLLETKK